MPSRHGQVDDRTADAGLTEPMALYLSDRKEVETLYTLPDDRKLVPVVIDSPFSQQDRVADGLRCELKMSERISI